MKEYEVWYNKENAALYQRLLASHGIKNAGVPGTFIGNRAPIIGFDKEETTGAEMEGMIGYCRSFGCPDPMKRLSEPASAVAKAESKEGCKEDESEIEIPLLGKINAKSTTLPVITVVLGGLDAFNPCAFYVLFMLLSMLVHAESRMRMFIIGGTFVFFSGLIYFLFMAAWLNIFILAGQVNVITMVAGGIAVIIALVNIKDYFYFRKGASLSIPESAKPKLFERMRGLLKESSLSMMLFGTVVLAIAANSYELLCTVGFPMIFTKILTLNNLPKTEYYLYILFYNLVYILPLLIIVIGFVITLGSRKLTEREGRILKLVSGVMMLLLGLILIINPALLNNFLAAGGVLLGAFAVSAVIVLVTDKKERPEDKVKTKAAGKKKKSDKAG